MISEEVYPAGFLPQISFPIFTKEDCEKLNTIVGVPFEADLIRFLTENSGKTSNKTCLVADQDGVYQVCGFVSKWVFDTLYMHQSDILTIQYEQDEDQLKELHENYMLLAEVSDIDTLWVGIKGKYKGKVLLLDEQRGQDMDEIWDYTTNMGETLTDFKENHLVDFEQHKSDENLYW